MENRYKKYNETVEKIIDMENKKEILLIAQKLTELRLKQKMLKWAFENSKGLPEEKMNAILDEKLRIDHLIKMLETKLKELEK